MANFQPEKALRQILFFFFHTQRPARRCCPYQRGKSQKGHSQNIAVEPTLHAIQRQTTLVLCANESTLLQSPYMPPSRAVHPKRPQIAPPSWCTGLPGSQSLRSGPDTPPHYWPSPIALASDCKLRGPGKPSCTCASEGPVVHGCKASAAHSKRQKPVHQGLPGVGQSQHAPTRPARDPY